MSHNRKKAGTAKGMMMIVARGVDAVTSQSQTSGRVKTRRTVATAGVAGPSTQPVEPYYEEDLATQAVRSALDFSWDLGGDSLEPDQEEERNDGITVLVGPPRNENSDRPLQTWVPHMDEYCAEALRREGRGSPRVYVRCAGSHCVDPDRKCPNHVCTGVAEYRCCDGVCFGEVMQCATCIVAAHAQLPTHFIEKWDGNFVKHLRMGLRELGLCVQLGHPPGVVCPARKPVAMDFVLYDVTGVHVLAVDFCGCKDEEWRTQLLRVCWWPATVKAPNTCATFADRRKPFMHIVRQWREVKHLKRAKRGHAAGGPGWNLPEGWKDVPLLFRFLYFLFLAQDAKFCLTNRSVSSEEADPILGDGFGYFATREGDDGYKAHIAKHASEQEISSCSGFQAMFLANMKRVKGLRTTGITGVTCSCYNMWRPNGMGDLQVGERYCNMDYLLLSALLVFAMWWIVVSYDIACQFSKNFWLRMEKMPEHMRLRILQENVWTHGEEVEQNWAFSNGVAASTKLMGPGSRHATLEDIFGFHNSDCQLAMHRILPKRLAEDIKEGAKHKTALEAFSEGLESTWPGEVAEWRAWVVRWEATQHTTPEDSPFEYKEAVTSLRDIQVRIAEEELILTEDGVEVEQEMSIWRRLEIDMKALQTPTASQKLAFMKRRTALVKKIHQFRQLQLVYMPALRGFLSDRERQILDGNGEQVPEATHLFMPSEIADSETRRRACLLGLGELEARMQEGEAREALELVQQGLRSRTMTNRFWIWNYTGQGALTRGQGILRQINIKIHLAKIHYRYARAVLPTLRGHDVWEEGLRVLKDEDIRALQAEDATQADQLDELRRALARPAGIAVAQGLAAGEGSHTLSWIWYAAGAKDDNDAQKQNDPKLHEALCVEWCKVYARLRRFDEDVWLLHEEMKRTVAYGETAAEVWDGHACAELPDATPELMEGRQAYAAEQADRERRTTAFLKRQWAGILARADEYLDGTVAEDTGEIMIQLDLGTSLSQRMRRPCWRARNEPLLDGPVWARQ
ncbi:hypothetical protein B0H13DRAFT_2384593 [Mycena leptocephala]|nr:hypothetical protein B0H13DRAFT_2384593 [Mycena leptocephala]